MGVTRRLQQGIAILAAGFLGAGAARALTFEFSFLPGTSAQAQSAFRAAGDLWSSVLADPVAVQLTVGMGALGSGALGQTLTGLTESSYASVRSAMVSDRSSANDDLAVGALPGGSSFAMLINHTAQNGDSATPYLDANGSANNTTLRLSTANAKSLGLPVLLDTLGGRCLAVCDGYIELSTAHAWDYDRSNGIGAGQFDFVGIAAHEIGHALGFLSGVDVLDSNTGFDEDLYALVSPLDLFRYSSASAAQGAIDFTASTTAKYLSLTGATSGSLLFATGAIFGDGRQASHWKDNLGLGLMDPTAASGQLLAIGINDQLAFDVIGWDLVSAVPEPGRPTLLAMGLAVLGIGWLRGRRRGR
jgi:hypothetical protein